jgi:hypothetical protein
VNYHIIKNITTFIDNETTKTSISISSDYLLLTGSGETKEEIIETKVCKQCSLNFDITNKDKEFYNKISPIFNDKKYLIPFPTLCPFCRDQRRLSFRNERFLYKRNSDFS